MRTSWALHDCRRRVTIVRMANRSSRPDADPPVGPSRLRDLRNLGPASERMLVAAGITTPRELDRLGSLEAYRRAIAAGGHRSLNFLWSLDAALLDVDWRDLPPERKSLLRSQVAQDDPAGTSSV